MLKVKFKIPVQIKGADGSRQSFKPGTYELDEGVVDHWFVQGLIAAGSAIIMEGVITPPSPQVKPEPPGAAVKLEQVEIEEVLPVKKATPVVDVVEEVKPKRKGRGLGLKL